MTDKNLAPISLRRSLSGAWVGVLLPLATLGLAAHAGAAVEVGQTDAGASYCNVPPYPNTYVQVESGTAPSYAMPSAGVVTAWKHHSGFAAVPVKLKIYRPTGVPGQYVTVGEHMSPPVVPSVLNTFTTGVRIPVLQGDVIGITVLAAGTLCRWGGGASDMQAFGFVDPPPGAVFTAAPAGNYSRINASVVLEPDGDGDGYGDETQDACPANPSTQATCPTAPAPQPPETVISKRPPNKVDARRVTYKFTVVSGDATFECKLDGKRFKRCDSPKNFRVGEGKHRFQVRGIAAGIVDPSPARDQFRVG